MIKPRIERIEWNDVQESVMKVNPLLANAINSINPNKDFGLYKAAYPYGATILKNGVFHIPDSNGTIIPINDSHTDKKIAQDLDYAGGGLPVGVVLRNSYELFIHTKNSALPIITTQPGSIIALWKGLESTPFFHPNKMFNINAGARSIFMLPNISDLALHKNLKNDFNIRQAPPKNLMDQWDIFKSLAQHPAAKCDWETELLFFSSKWLEKIKNDEAWQLLLLVLLGNGWNSSAYERNRMFYDFTVSCAQENRNLKPNPYLTDTLRHLLMIGMGAGVGFGVATDDTLAPIQLLQNIYLESYGLRKYAPTVLHPMHFSWKGFSSPVYYSLSLPTTLEFSPKSRKVSSTLYDLSELKHILEVFFEEVSCGHLKIEDTIIRTLAEDINFDFFHSKFDRHSEIKLTSEMVKGDSALHKSLAQYEGRELAESGTFVRGCVRISYKGDCIKS